MLAGRAGRVRCFVLYGQWFAVSRKNLCATGCGGIGCGLHSWARYSRVGACLQALFGDLVSTGQEPGATEALQERPWCFGVRAVGGRMAWGAEVGPELRGDGPGGQRTGLPDRVRTWRQLVQVQSSRPRGVWSVCFFS